MVKAGTEPELGGPAGAQDPPGAPNGKPGGVGETERICFGIRLACGVVEPVVVPAGASLFMPVCCGAAWTLTLPSGIGGGGGSANERAANKVTAATPTTVKIDWQRAFFIPPDQCDERATA
jgi:hypothetical protein